MHADFFKRANFPDKGMEIWSFLVDAGNPKLVYAGGSPVAVYRSEDSGDTWKRRRSRLRHRRDGAHARSHIPHD